MHVNYFLIPLLSRLYCEVISCLFWSCSLEAQKLQRTPKISLEKNTLLILRNYLITFWTYAYNFPKCSIVLEVFYENPLSSPMFTNVNHGKPRYIFGKRKGYTTGYTPEVLKIRLPNHTKPKRHKKPWWWQGPSLSLVVHGSYLQSNFGLSVHVHWSPMFSMYT